MAENIMSNVYPIPKCGFADLGPCPLEGFQFDCEKLTKRECPLQPEQKLPPQMQLEFTMDAPNACIDCRFHTIDKADRYGGWFARCLIDRDLKMAVKDSLERRHEKCPGRIV